MELLSSLPVYLQNLFLVVSTADLPRHGIFEALPELVRLQSTREWAIATVTLIAICQCELHHSSLQESLERTLSFVSPDKQTLFTHDISIVLPPLDFPKIHFGSAVALRSISASAQLRKSTEDFTPS